MYEAELLIEVIPRLKSFWSSASVSTVWAAASGNSIEENINHLNASPKVEMLDKGLTTNSFTIHFFSIVPRHVGSLYLS